MDNKDIVSIDWTLNELELSKAPKWIAYTGLKSLVHNKQLSLYFNVPVFGVSSKDGYELTTDDNGEITGALIHGGYGKLHSGLKKATSFTAHKNNGEYFLSVGEYEISKKKFYPTDETSMWIDFLNLDEDDFFLDRNEVEKLKSVTEIKTQNQFPSNSHTGVQGALKALALLAREAADTKLSFRHGTKVNSSAFKKHIIKLSKFYLEDDEFHKPDSGLVKLDDIISKALDKYDLRKIDKKN